MPSTALAMHARTRYPFGARRSVFAFMPVPPLRSYTAAAALAGKGGRSGAPKAVGTARRKVSPLTEFTYAARTRQLPCSVLPATEPSLPGRIPVTDWVGVSQQALGERPRVRQEGGSQEA